MAKTPVTSSILGIDVNCIYGKEIFGRLTRAGFSHFSHRSNLTILYCFFKLFVIRKSYPDFNKILSSLVYLVSIEQTVKMLVLFTWTVSNSLTIAGYLPDGRIINTA